MFRLYIDIWESRLEDLPDVCRVVQTSPRRDSPRSMSAFLNDTTVRSLSYLLPIRFRVLPAALIWLRSYTCYLPIICLCGRESGLGTVINLRGRRIGVLENVIYVAHLVPTPDLFFISCACNSVRATMMSRTSTEDAVLIVFSAGRDMLSTCKHLTLEERGAVPAKRTQDAGCSDLPNPSIPKVNLSQHSQRDYREEQDTRQGKNRNYIHPTLNAVRGHS